MIAATFEEQALVFDCCGESLVGVLSRPESPARIAVLIVVGGPQYRVGSHRHFVLLARALAHKGVAVLRFDYRGMGDSGGEARAFETVDDDIAAALDALSQAVPSVRQVALLGLCDAASAALLYAHERADDGRVAALVLMNPWVRSSATLAKTHVKHYYLRRLRERDFWLKLGGGKVGWRSVSGLLKNLTLAITSGRAAQPGESHSFQQRMASAWARTPAQLWLVLSGEDYTAKEFLETFRVDPAWSTARARQGVQQLDIATADHTFSAIDHQRLLADWLTDELDRWGARASAATS